MGAVTKPDKLLSPRVKITCSFMCGCWCPLQDAVFQLGGGGGKRKGCPYTGWEMEWSWFQSHFQEISGNQI